MRGGCLGLESRKDPKSLGCTWDLGSQGALKGKGAASPPQIRLGRSQDVLAWLFWAAVLAQLPILSSQAASADVLGRFVYHRSHPHFYASDKGRNRAGSREYRRQVVSSEPAMYEVRVSTVMSPDVHADVASALSLSGSPFAKQTQLNTWAFFGGKDSIEAVSRIPGVISVAPIEAEDKVKCPRSLSSLFSLPKHTFQTLVGDSPSSCELKRGVLHLLGWIEQVRLMLRFCCTDRPQPQAAGPGGGISSWQESWKGSKSPKPRKLRAIREGGGPERRMGETGRSRHV